METLAADVWATLGADPDAGARLIAHGGTNRWLPLWFPGAVLRTIWLVLRGKVDIVLTGDVATYLLLAPLLRALRVRHATMAMGKDIVWSSPSYQRAVRAGIGKAPLVLAISSATAEVAISHGAVRERVRVVRLGVQDPHVSEADRREARAGLRERFSIHSSDVTLLTLGRLVKRKGVEWFIREVLPKVPDGVVYLVAGGGEDGARIDAAVAALPDPSRVRVLGAVSSEDRELLMRGADLFIQPNVPVAGDMEGFGLVAVEAALRGALVVAADLEGLRDAVDDGSTGYLVPPEDSEAWAAQIQTLLDDGPLRDQTARAFSDAARVRYSTVTMGRELRRLLALESAAR
jgi:glycosyltransferase involved in cell wall biosynthesis